MDTLLKHGKKGHRRDSDQGSTSAKAATVNIFDCYINIKLPLLNVYIIKCILLGSVLHEQH